MDSGHRYGDMLAFSATQWSVGGRGSEACAGDLAAYSTPGSHLGRYAARALNSVIRAARQRARENLTFLGAWSKEIWNPRVL
jgi:hypothetical protein